MLLEAEPPTSELDVQALKVTKGNNRRYERSPLNTTVNLKNSRFGGRIPARVLNISETGACVEILDQKKLHVGQTSKFRLVGYPGHKKPVKVRGFVTNQHTNGRFGVHFDQLIEEQIRRQNSRTRRFLTVLVALAVAALIAVLKFRNVISFWYGPVIQAYSIGAGVYLLSRVVLSMFYREPRDNKYLPSVSLIVAVKNEETHIAETVAHCLKSRYPSDLLELIVVDDGSTDKTWDVLESLKEKYERFRCFRFPKNRGKRHAMALGTREASGDILVFIDSDTFLEQEAIYRLVQPFADDRIGAVAGHTLVLVEEDNVISKMEAVRYYVSQRVMKAAESVFNSVTCCPGPLSGYRKSYVEPILDQWENQMFLGRPATFGDDRSLTNFILRNYRVVYHAGARCATYTPSTLIVFLRQQLRWKKSWLRELTVAGLFMWKKHPIAAFSYYMAMVITLVSPLIALGALLGLPFIGVPFNFGGYLGGLLLAYAFLGLIFHYHTQSKHWLYGMVFAVLYVCILSFQNYYALLTVRENQWGTR